MGIIWKYEKTFTWRRIVRSGARGKKCNVTNKLCVVQKTMLKRRGPEKI